MSYPYANGGSYSRPISSAYSRTSQPIKPLTKDEIYPSQKPTSLRTEKLSNSRGLDVNSKANDYLQEFTTDPTKHKYIKIQTNNETNSYQASQEKRFEK